MSAIHSYPTEHDIAVCAYSICEQEGRPEGRALDHWLQAETQLAASSQHDEAATGQKKSNPRKRAKTSSNP